MSFPPKENFLDETLTSIHILHKNSLFLFFFVLLHTTVIHSVQSPCIWYIACLLMIHDTPVCRHVNIARTVSQFGVKYLTLSLNQLYVWLGCTYIVSLRHTICTFFHDYAVTEHCWQTQYMYSGRCTTILQTINFSTTQSWIKASQRLELDYWIKLGSKSPCADPTQTRGKPLAEMDSTWGKNPNENWQL